MQPTSPATNRYWEIDVARGLMLVLMTLTHLPTRLTLPLGQPFGFVSAAEGFVLLSAFVAGLVYTRLLQRQGAAAMRSAFGRRALKIYACQAAMLLFLFTVVAAVGQEINEPAVKNLMHFYLVQPVKALVGSLLLAYQPPLLDILPLYVLFMLASPWVLTFAARRGWRGPLAVSLALWVLAQFGLSSWMYGRVVALTGPLVPFETMGSFHASAWQLLWMLGLWMGANRSDPAVPPFRFPRWTVVVAVVLAVIAMVWRHTIGQVPFPAQPGLNPLFDKWMLGPLRLLNLLMLVLLAIRFGPTLLRRLPRMRWLETLGAASLPVFCTHLLAVLLALGLLGDNPSRHAWWVDGLVLALCLGLLTAVAEASGWLDRNRAARQGGHDDASFFDCAAYLPPPIVEPLQPPQQPQQRPLQQGRFPR